MKAKFGLLFTLVALGASVVALTIAPSATSARPTTSALAVPISGTTSQSSFVGTFTLQSFKLVDGTLSAVGQLSGTLTNLATGATSTINQQITLPVANISGTCQILHLELGPLDLDLLGLQVHLDKVVLDITAQSGPGNLLGNLLCSVAHLLDSSGSGISLTQLVNQLNAILGAL
jgi:hypothetical protein